MAISLLKLLEDDALDRIKMGRFSEADERQMEQLVRGRPSLFRNFGRGANHPDLASPGLFSTRPRTADGRHSFTFSHRTVSKNARREVPRDRIYLSPTPAGAALSLREAGARWDPKVRIDGRTGGWWIAPGASEPAGTRVASDNSVVIGSRGFSPSMPASKQRYIERDNAVEARDNGHPISVGNITDQGGSDGGGLQFRENFWHAVVDRERADGRVQSTVIAELPYEPVVGPEGRARIVEDFGGEIEKLGLKWHAVVHEPDEHGDRRNYHMHLLYHERGAQWDSEGKEWVFDRVKNPVTRKRGFIRDLRAKYAAVVNKELKRQNLVRRLDPRTYEEMGIDKRPTRHLGSSAHALERRGVVTTIGQWNYASEFMYRAGDALRALRQTTNKETAVINRIRPVFEESTGALSPLVRTAADHVADAVHDLAETGEALRDARSALVVAGWRANDFPRRARAVAEGGQSREQRTESRDLVKALEGGTGEARGRAFQQLLDARRKYRTAARRMLTSERLLVGERLLDERAGQLVRRDMAEQAIGARRASTDTWDDAVHIARAERLRLEEARTAARSSAINALEHETATGVGSDEWFRRRLLTPAGRDKLIHLSPENIGLRNAVRELGRIDIRLAELEGDERRRLRFERAARETDANDPSAVVDRPLQDVARSARRRLDKIDADIQAHPTALRLARSRGLIERLGRDGERSARKSTAQTRKQRQPNNRGRGRDL